jgi:hypothetical protein
MDISQSKHQSMHTVAFHQNRRLLPSQCPKHARSVVYSNCNSFWCAPAAFKDVCRRSRSQALLRAETLLLSTEGMRASALYACASGASNMVFAGTGGSAASGSGASSWCFSMDHFSSLCTAQNSNSAPGTSSACTFNRRHRVPDEMCNA